MSKNCVRAQCDCSANVSMFSRDGVLFTQFPLSHHSATPPAPPSLKRKAKPETVNWKVRNSEVQSSKNRSAICSSRREHYISRREHYISRREHYIPRRELQIAVKDWKPFTSLLRTFQFTVSGFAFRFKDGGADGVADGGKGGIV